ncbi:alginate export family protein [Salinicola avicenniae]|uniref:alginate export family protein n=1 Tax=Salinicola avicenniae TaxID=2916836 RepID=UPI002072DE46|nr:MULTISPECIES: alginate export family protein [unclassified Salinicola]
MNDPRALRAPRRCHLAALAAGLFASPAFAITAVTDIDYQQAGIVTPSTPHALYESDDGHLRLNGGLTLYGFGAATDHVNFGSDSSIDGGAPTGTGPDWWEASAVPSATVEWDVAGGGTWFTGIQGIYSMTRGSAYGDASGATPGHPEEARLDRAYLGWRSGGLWADTLGEDALTLSAGRQKFTFGDGFLIGDGFTDTGKYAGYYIGPSEGFKNSVVASLDSHGWHGDLFHLEADQYVSGGPDQETRANGANVDYTWGERAKVGGAYVRVDDSDIDGRDGMDVYNLRAKGQPFAAVPDLSLGGQLVHEKNRDEGVDDNGWYVQVTYDFSDVPWTPQVAYRHAEFGEDYDTLFYDFAGGWGNWFMGEIVGEYMLFNANLDVDMLRASVAPRDDLETGVIAYRFRYHDTEAAGASDSDFANELNVYADWSMTQRLSLSAIYAVADPQRGAEARFGGNDDTAQLFELFATYSF